MSKQRRFKELKPEINADNLESQSHFAIKNNKTNFDATYDTNMPIQLGTELWYRHIVSLLKKFDYGSVSLCVKEVFVQNNVILVNRTIDIINNHINTISSDKNGIIQIIKLYDSIGEIFPLDNIFHVEILETLKKIILETLSNENSKLIITSVLKFLDLYHYKLYTFDSYKFLYDLLNSKLEEINTLEQKEEEKKLEELVLANKNELALDLCNMLIDKYQSIYASILLPSLLIHQAKQGSDPNAFKVIPENNKYEKSWIWPEPSNEAHANNIKWEEPVLDRKGSPINSNNENIPFIPLNNPIIIKEDSLKLATEEKSEGIISKENLSEKNNLELSSDILPNGVLKNNAIEVNKTDFIDKSSQKKFTKKKQAYPLGLTKKQLIGLVILSSLIIILGIVVAYLYIEQTAPINEAQNKNENNNNTKTTTNNISQDKNHVQEKEYQFPQGAFGFLTLNVTPNDLLELYINEELIPDAKIKKNKYPAGKHTIEIYRPGYDKYQQTVLINPNNETTVDATLKRLPVISIYTIPMENIEIKIDSQKIGVDSPIIDYSVTEGEHQLEVTSQGYSTYFEKFAAVSGMSLKFEVKLKELK